jgi:hypothetical protein
MRLKSSAHSQINLRDIHETAYPPEMWAGKLLDRFTGEVIVIGLSREVNPARRTVFSMKPG